MKTSTTVTKYLEAWMNTQQLCAFKNGGGLDWGMCFCAGGRGEGGDRESAMFGMQLRPRRAVAPTLLLIVSFLRNAALIWKPCNSKFRNFHVLASTGLWGLHAPWENASTPGALEGLLSINHFQRACWRGVKQRYFLTVPPENLTYWQYKVFTWQQQ